MSCDEWGFWLGWIGKTFLGMLTSEVSSWCRARSEIAAFVAVRLSMRTSRRMTFFFSICILYVALLTKAVNGNPVPIGFVLVQSLRLRVGKFGSLTSLSSNSPSSCS